MAAAIPCPSCTQPLPDSLWNRPSLALCPTCAKPVRGVTFPARDHRVVGRAPEQVIIEGEATCFFHADKKAVVPCGHCGRFLCALCDVELNGQHLCATCLESGRRQGQIATLENRRFRWDKAALALAAAPVVVPVFIYFTLLTAPATFAVIAIGWKKPRSILGGGRWRFIVAGILALAEIGAWIAILINLARS
jgi:hypothetical protein